MRRARGGGHGTVLRQSIARTAGEYDGLVALAFIVVLLMRTLAIVGGGAFNRLQRYLVGHTVLCAADVHRAHVFGPLAVGSNRENRSRNHGKFSNYGKRNEAHFKSKMKQKLNPI